MPTAGPSRARPLSVLGGRRPLWKPRLCAWPGRPVVQPLTIGLGEKTVQGRRKIKTSIPESYNQLSELVYGFCFKPQQGQEAEQGDECVRGRQVEAVLSAWHVRRSAWRPLVTVHRRQEAGGQGPAPESLLASIPLGPHAGDFTPRFRVPAGRRPRSPRPAPSQFHWAPPRVTF